MALKNTYYLDVDIKKKYSENLPKFRKGDSGVLVFKLHDNNELYPLPNSATATLYQITQGGTRLNAPCTLKTNDGVKVFEYEFRKTDTIDKGYNTAILVVNDGDSVISIQPFEVIIYDDLQGGEGSFIDLIQDLEKLIKELTFNPSDLINISEKGIPNGVATLDSNGKIPISQIPIDSTAFENHITQTVFNDEVHGMRIKDGFLQIKTPDGYINAGTKPSQNQDTIRAEVVVSEGIATVTYIGNLAVVNQKWASGNRSASYFTLNGNYFSGNTFPIAGVGEYTLWFNDARGGIHTLVFNVTESMLPTTNITVVVNDGEVDVTISRPVTIKKWAKGERDITYFATSGTVFTGNTFNVTEVGTYTIYYKIDTGAEYVYLFEVTDSMLTPTAPPPEISISTVNGFSTVSINPYYTPSKYAFGDFAVEYFTSNGTLITGNTFGVTQAGLYTLYYTGSNGEKSVYTFVVEESMLYQDIYAPYIRINSLTPSTWTNQPVIVDFNVSDESDIEVVKIASGERNLSYFSTNGIIINEYHLSRNQFGAVEASYNHELLLINQKYTIYAKDVKGNDVIEIFEVTNIDTTSPILELSQVNADTSQIIVINAYDDESGIYTISLPDGRVLMEDNHHYFVDFNGTYTITATDNAGNIRSKSITVTRLSQ